MTLHYLHESFGLCFIIKKKKPQKFIFCDGIVWYIQSINIFFLQPTVQNTVREICDFVRLLKYVLAYLGLLWNRDVDLLLQMECQLPTWCSQAWFLYSQIWMIWWTTIPFKVGNSFMPICPDHAMFLNSSLKFQRYWILHCVFIFNNNRPCFHLSDIVTTRSQGNSVMHFTGNQSMDTSTNTSVRKLCILFRASVIL